MALMVLFVTSGQHIYQQVTGQLTLQDMPIVRQVGQSAT